MTHHAATPCEHARPLHHTHTHTHTPCTDPTLRHHATHHTTDAHATYHDAPGVGKRRTALHMTDRAHGAARINGIATLRLALGRNPPLPLKEFIQRERGSTLGVRALSLSLRLSERAHPSAWTYARSGARAQSLISTCAAARLRDPDHSGARPRAHTRTDLHP